MLGLWLAWITGVQIVITGVDQINIRDIDMTNKDYKHEQQKKQGRKNAVQWRKRRDVKRSQWVEKGD